MIERKREALWHHAHDGARRGAQLHRATDDVRIGGEACAPRIVADEQDGCGARLLVALEQVAAQRRRHSRNAKSRGGDLGDADHVWQNAAAEQRTSGLAERAEILNVGDVRPPGCQIVERTPLGRVRRRIPVLHGDDAVALVQRERGVEHAVDDAERAHGDGDRDRHAESADERQARIPDQHAHGEPDVEPPLIEQRERSRVALSFFRLFDLAAERAARGKTCLGGAHAARDEVVFEQLQVRGDLAREVGVGRGAAEGGEQSGDEANHGVR
jgi:hypothetical protein